VAVTGDVNEHGRPLYVVSQMLDVTDRHRAEAALLASEAELRAVLAAITDVVLVLDASGRYVKIAGSCQELLYRPVDKLLGRTTREVFPPEQAAAFEGVIRRALETGERVPHDYSLDIEGERRWFTGSASPMQGHPLVVWVARDVTAERVAVDALAAREAELRQAQKLEAVGQLASGVAHDFNNLLTVITSYGELLREALPDGDPRRDDVAEIVRAAKRGGTLTRQLLAFSRKQVLQPRVLDLNAVVHGAAALFKAAAGADASFVTDLSPEPAVVHADPGQVERVLMSLVVNARDAMPEGGTLTIRTRNMGGVVEVAVADTGTGMSDAVAARVFEPFFSTKELGKGTGLGLATVYGIVQQSGGSISVRTAVGEGSTFTVRLPRSTAAAPDLSAPVDSPTAPRGAGTVLLVDDEPGVRTALRRALELAGYSVHAADDGVAALGAWDAAAGAIDLVITDLSMPGMGGRALGRRLRTLRPALPMIAISGYVDGGAPGLAGVEWATTVLEKPFTGEVLVRAVRTALESRVPRAPNAAVTSH
jgi:PAS domain S-box-containing protein